MKTYSTTGTCSRAINYEVEDGVLTKCEFVGGCPGNTRCVAKLAIGRKVEEVIAGIKAGTLHVFDAATFTVNGAALDSYQADVDSDAAYTPDTEVIADGYFHESEYRSAPYFDILIDGITEA